jgi:hypothetical protein
MTSFGERSADERPELADAARLSGSPSSASRWDTALQGRIAPNIHHALADWFVPEGDVVWYAARYLHEALAGRALTRSDFRVPSTPPSTSLTRSSPSPSPGEAPADPH